MCGIVGYVNTASSEAARSETIAAMCETIIHRGPNDMGMYVEGPVGLGMRRLSVIDLNSGHQPIANETKTVWVVFNGEIYNFQELAKDLKRRGHQFKTASDTEVIVHLYEEFGDECVNHLRGMFAFAVWDEERSRLLLARDRLGVKPLYYFWDERLLVFGSELKALLVHPAVKRKLSSEALLYYLQYSYVPDPLTILENIFKIAPASTLSLKGKTIQLKQYWDGCRPHEPEGSRLSEDEAIIQLEQMLTEAVGLRLISDVPLGAFLSGGIDSSLVVALMARQMNQAVKTFSIGFGEESFNELPYARRVAKHLGTDHHELVVSPQHCNLIEQLVRHFDEPFADSSAIPTYYLSKLAAEHVTVALSGDGGDELFAGYDRYKIDLSRRKFEAVPSMFKNAFIGLADSLPQGIPGKNLLRAVSLPPIERYLENVSYFHNPELKKLLSHELQNTLLGSSGIFARHFDAVQGQPWLSQLQYVDTKTYLSGDVLTKVDRMSMAHSLEVRGPLLDHIVFEYAASLPAKFKLNNGISKYLLKQLAKKFLPSEIVTRRKQGFGVPLEFWFKNGLREYVHDVLFDSSLNQRGILNQKEVRKLVDLYEGGRNELSANIWILIVLET